MKKIIDKTLLIYAGLGLLNYGFCNAVMVILRNVVGMEQLWYLIICFLMQSIISFVLNRYVTFRGLEISKYWPLKFLVSVCICYLGAKVLLLRLCVWAIELPVFVAASEWLKGFLHLSMEASRLRGTIADLMCTFIYCVINYVGQRYYVFRPVEKRVADN